MVGKADAAQFRRYLPIAWQCAFTFQRYLFSTSFLGITSTFFMEEKKTVKFGIIGQERITKRGAVLRVKRDY